MKPDMQPINLGSIANGAAKELFDKCIAQIAENIADRDTEAEASRSLTITFKFKPDADRRSIQIYTSAKTTLAGAEEHSSRAYLGKTTDGLPLVLDQDPRQDVLFETPKQEDNLLGFRTGERG